MASKGSKTIDRLRKRDGDHCWLCNLMINWAADYGSTPDSATRDHVVPRSHGGSDRLSNQRLAHKICNQHRGHDAKTYGPVSNPKRGRRGRNPTPLVEPESTYRVPAPLIVEGDGLRKHGGLR